MLKKTITYTDFNDNQVTEDFYFNLTKMELIELDFAEKGELSDKLKEIVAKEDHRGILQMFKALVMKSYGVRSEDGKRFIKSQELADAFMQTDAFSELFVELMTGEQAAIDFFNAVMPASVRNSGAKEIETVQLPEKPKDPKDMTREELLAAFKEKAQNRK